MRKWNWSRWNLKTINQNKWGLRMRISNILVCRLKSRKSNFDLHGSFCARGTFMPHHGQTKEICQKKKRKILQRKSCHFYCSKFDTLPVFYWFTKKKYCFGTWKLWGNSGLLAPCVKAILSGCGAFQSKETRLCERYENTFTLNSYYVYPAQVSTSLWMKTHKIEQKNGPRTFDLGGLHTMCAI